MCALQGPHSGTQKMRNFILVKFLVKKLANAIFAVKRSILLRFSNFKNRHLQNYQTELTICLNFMCYLQGPHSGTQKMRNFILVKFLVKKLENDIFAVKRSILLRSSNFKNWHLQNYQTKLTICLNFMCALWGPHSGTQKMRIFFWLKNQQMAFLLLNAQFFSDSQILKTGIYRIITQNQPYV